MKYGELPEQSPPRSADNSNAKRAIRSVGYGPKNEPPAESKE